MDKDQHFVDSAFDKDARDALLSKLRQSRDAAKWSALFGALLFTVPGLLASDKPLALISGATGFIIGLMGGTEGLY